MAQKPDSFKHKVKRLKVTNMYLIYLNKNNNSVKAGYHYS